MFFMKKYFSSSAWSVLHPNAGQKIQHSYALVTKLCAYIFKDFFNVDPMDFTVIGHVHILQKGTYTIFVLKACVVLVVVSRVIRLIMLHTNLK